MISTKRIAAKRILQILNDVKSCKRYLKSILITKPQDHKRLPQTARVDRKHNLSVKIIFKINLKNKIKLCKALSGIFVTHNDILNQIVNTQSV